MMALALIVATALFAANAVAVNPLIVNLSSLNATLCQPLTFTWSGGTPPYLLTVGRFYPSDDLFETELLGMQTGTSFTWLVNLVSGGSFILNITDAAGDFGRSSPFEIQDSPDHTCLPDLIVYTPLTGTVCEQLTLSWSGGTPPYEVTIAQFVSEPTTGGWMDGVGIQTFTGQTARFLNWVVDKTFITGGDTFFVNVFDSVGHFSQSPTFNIHDSTNHSCISSTPSVSSIGSSPTSTTPSTPVGSSSKSSLISEGKILGIGLGLLAALFLLAMWRIYMLRTSRQQSTNQEDPENLGLDQKIPLSPIQKHFK